MATYNTVITNQGVTALTEAIGLGQQVQLVRAQAGNGIPGVGDDPAVYTELVSAITITCALGEMSYIPGASPPIAKIPVQVTNEGITEPASIREVGVFARDASDQEYLFAYTWIQGPDTDNIIPVSGDSSFADTMHIHDIAIVVTNDQAGAITIQYNGDSAVTFSQLEDYVTQSKLLKIDQTTTMEAPLTAQANTGYMVRQVRNFFLTDQEIDLANPPAGMQNGDVVLQYEVNE